MATLLKGKGKAGSAATKDGPLLYALDPALEGKSFVTATPPEVSKRTRFLAICGITDLAPTYKADPKKDGWFFSDLFLFWQLLKDAPVANKLFFTCVPPSVLVKRYKRYTHGSPYSDRRVVLDESHLDQMTFSNGWRISKPADLLRDFEAALRKEAEIAGKNDQDLLICLFGHGFPRTHSVVIGATSNTNFPEADVGTIVPVLTIDKIAAAVGTKVNCAMYSNSCFGGGWAHTPNLNMTVMAAAGMTEESHAWTVTKSLNFPGAMVTDALLEALFRAEETELANKAAPFGEIQLTQTYAGLGNLVHEELKKMDYMHQRHQISFSAQGDAFEKPPKGQTMVGFPVGSGRFKKAWEDLETVPAQPDDPKNTDPLSAWNADPDRNREANPHDSLHPTGSAPPNFLELEECLSDKATAMQICSRTKTLAAAYMLSSPGSSGRADNTGVNNRCDSQYIAKMKIGELMMLFKNLKYRIEVMQEATGYAQRYRLGILPCAQFDVEKWELDTLKASQKGDENAKNKWSKFHNILDMVYEKIVFPNPSDYVKRWSKPTRHIAIAFTTIVDRNEIKRCLQEIVDSRKKVLTQQAVDFIDTQPAPFRKKIEEKFETLGRKLKPRAKISISEV